MTAEQEAELVVALERAVHVGVLAPRVGPTIRALLEERRAMKEALEAFMIPKDQLARPLSVIELKARAALVLAARKVD